MASISFQLNENGVPTYDGEIYGRSNDDPNRKIGAGSIIKVDGKWYQVQMNGDLWGCNLGPAGGMSTYTGETIDVNPDTDYVPYSETPVDKPQPDTEESATTMPPKPTEEPNDSPEEPEPTFVEAPEQLLYAPPQVTEPEQPTKPEPTTVPPKPFEVDEKAAQPEFYAPGWTSSDDMVKNY